MLRPFKFPDFSPYPVIAKFFTEEIVAWIFLNPAITTEEIAKKIGKSQSTVGKTVKKLKEAGMLKRIGSAKAGYWKSE